VQLYRAWAEPTSEAATRTKAVRATHDAVRLLRPEVLFTLMCMRAGHGTTRRRARVQFVRGHDTSRGRMDEAQQARHGRAAARARRVGKQLGADLQQAVGLLGWTYFPGAPFRFVGNLS
jgi:hypothetical protein